MFSQSIAHLAHISGKLQAVIRKSTSSRANKFPVGRNDRNLTHAFHDVAKDSNKSFHKLIKTVFQVVTDKTLVVTNDAALRKFRITGKMIPQMKTRTKNIQIASEKGIKNGI